MAIPVTIAYSPKTQTDGITAIGATEIVIDDTVNEGIESFPVASVDAPGVAVLCSLEHFNSEDPSDYETITYTERHDGSKELRGVTREVEGTAREWPDGTWIASYTSADAWNKMRAQIATNVDDIAEAKGIAELAPFKNKLINGNFDIWQRGVVSTSAGGLYLADRWRAFSTQINAIEYSQESFTIGQTDVPGEPKYFHRTDVTTSGTDGTIAIIQQRIESVRTLAGQKATVSFKAKADANKNISIEFVQNFGSGGSPSADVVGIGAVKIPITTAWQKYSVTVDIPSIAGKTLGTTDDGYLNIVVWFSAGVNLAGRTDSLENQSGIFDIAQIQVEKGETATEFEKRPVSTELALCQRYFWRHERTTTEVIGYGYTPTTTSIRYHIPTPVTMRIAPSITNADTWYCLFVDSGTYSPTITTGDLRPSGLHINITDVDPAITSARPTILTTNGDISYDAEF